MGDDFIFFFSSTIVVKQRHPLTPTIFGLCIDELEQMIFKFSKEEGIEEVIIKNVVVLLLLYLDDVMPFLSTSRDTQKLMRALEEFGVYASNMKNQNKDKP